MRVFFATIIAAALLGCPSKHQGPPAPQDTTQSPGEGGEASAVADGTSAAPAAGSAASMDNGFPKAYQGFREHAARVLDAPVDDIQGGPSYEEAANQAKETVGGAWALSCFRKDDPPTKVFGWAEADGTVITLEQNLGALFQEAGEWSEGAALDAVAMAQRLVWAMGMNHRLRIEPEMQRPAPTLSREDDGSGSLVFFVGYRPPGPGGPGGGLEDVVQVTVKLGADGGAELSKTPQ